jgi:hypothetical protein
MRFSAMHNQRLAKLASSLADIERPDVIEAQDCGTAARAIGRAALDPELRAAGLRVVAGLPEYDGEVEYEAIAAFFGIPPSSAVWIFHPGSYGGAPGPADVVARIQQLLRRSLAA